MNENENEAPRLLRISEFCRRYAIGRTKAYEEMNAKRLAFFWLGRHRRISIEAAEAWLALLEGAKNDV
jgi:excisionase family DNA binding protein